MPLYEIEIKAVVKRKVGTIEAINADEAITEAFLRNEFVGLFKEWESRCNGVEVEYVTAMEVAGDD